MKLTARFYISFFLIQIIIIGTLFISLWLLYANKKQPLDSLNNQPNPTPLPEVVMVKDENQLAENGSMGDYILSIQCPSGYGVRDIQCTPSTSNNTLNSIAQNIAVSGNTGAFCSYKANPGFKGTIEAICDKKLFGIPVYNASNFSPGVNSQIPVLFEIWMEDKTEKIAESQYSIRLSCPSGYTASNIRCNEYLQNISSPSELLSSNSTIENGDYIGKCQYRSSNPTRVTIRINCQK